MPLKVKENRGVALIIVMMLTAVMAVIMLYLSGKGQNSARLASIIKNNTTATLEVESAQANIIFEFTTTAFGIVGPMDDFQGAKIENAYTNSFNGEKNKTQGLQVSTQDLSGLVSLVPFNRKSFITLLVKHGVAQEAIPGILDRLDDWQDKDDLVRLEGAERGDYEQPFLPTNMPFQNKKELIYILQDLELYKRIEPYITLYSGDYIVRQFMPKTLYSLFGFSGQDTDSDNVESRIYPSGRYLFEVSAYESVRVTKRFILIRGQDSFRPYFIIDDELIFR